MMRAIERIRKADSSRDRVADFEFNGETIPLKVRVYPIREFQQIVERLDQSSEEGCIRFLSEQFSDPETGAPVFTVDDLLDSSMALNRSLLLFFGAVNKGDFDQKKI